MYYGTYVDPNMENHLKFQEGQQGLFLLKVQETSGFSVNQLAKIAQVSARNYRDWKNEKLNISLSSATKFKDQFHVDLPEDIEVLVNRWLEFKQQIYINGGKRRFLKYGSFGTLEGRQKGGSRALAILRARGIIPEKKIYPLPSEKTTKLAELVGILLGDGSLTSTQITITLNSVADKDYVLFVDKLLKDLFQTEFKHIKKRDCNAIMFYINSIFISDYFKKIGLIPGNKVQHQVDVPNWIKLSPRFRIACLRGLMDTDGGIFLHKYKVNEKVYIYKKVCFTNRSVPLLNFVYGTLTENGFNPKMISKVENKKVWLYNKDETEKYLKIIGTHNNRLLKYQLESGQDGNAAAC